MMIKLKTVAVFFFALVLTALVTAYVMKTVYLPTTFTIEKTYNIELYGTDGETPLTTLDFGQCVKDRSKFMPGGNESAPEGEYYFLNNTDEAPFYVGFNVVDAPPDVIFHIWFKRGDASGWWDGEVDTSSPATVIYGTIIESNHTDPDPDTQFAYWYILIMPRSTSTGGSYDASLVFTAHDTSNG
jgi:hypothetical protein